MKRLVESWLALQCRFTPGAKRGVVLLGEPERGPFAAVACWPDAGAESRRVSEAAQLAMIDRRGVVRAPRDEEGEGPRGFDVIAVPLLVGDELWGCVAQEVPHQPKAQQEAILQLLHWGCGSLALLLEAAAERNAKRAQIALELLAHCLEAERFDEAATTVATELASRLSLERVAIGFLDRGRVRLGALSHSAGFVREAEAIRLVEDAMHEAVDQGASVIHPATEDSAGVCRAHEALARHAGAAAVASVPLTDGARPIGAMTFEQHGAERRTREVLSLFEALASLLGPVLELRRRQERAAAERIRDAARAFPGRVFGPRHATAKLCAAGLLAATILLAIVPASYRVSATATLEGTVLRAVVAAMDGFVLEEKARAGDVVEAGATLAVLDDRDLRLERLKWHSRREQTAKEYRDALARSEWAEVSILSARVAQADAELQLIDDQLARTNLVAPFDGVVLQGDLSQSLGSPVERGQVLFEVAPLDSYRIILEVDEHEIDEIAPGQRGALALTSMPGEPLALAVERITPMATAEGGRNYFRVEASLEEPSQDLRPGMEGVAKIEVDRRPLLWIFTHGLIDRLRLSLWTWWP